MREEKKKKRKRILSVVLAVTMGDVHADRMWSI